MGYLEAARALNNISVEGNMFLRTFVNTALSTFDAKSEISIWTSTLDVLFYDIKSLDKLVLSVRSSGTLDKDTLSERIKIFKDMLSIDFDTDLRITSQNLNIPMVELWSTTKEQTVWIDKSEFNFSIEDKGKTVCIPYDYFMVHKPILFCSAETELTDFSGEYIKLDGLGGVLKVLPYIEYTI